MHKGRTKFFLIALLTIIWVLIMIPPSQSEDGSQRVYVIPVKTTINPGLVKFVERSFEEAVNSGAQGIVLEIDTPGGRIDSAIDISNLVLNQDLPVTAYVNKEASSAGVLITISCDNIYMASGSTIGAAEPRPKEEKYVSAWAAKLREVAERNNRDPQIVASMADADISIPGVIEKGKILTLTSKEALELGLADGIIDSMAELSGVLKIPYENFVALTPSFAEKLSFMVTNPLFSPVLVSLGFAGMIMEVFTPGWGLPGIVGLTSFSLFFGGHLIAGLAGWEVIVSFVLGILFLLIEIFVPGFGVFGILGILGIIGSIIAASVTFQQGILTIGISLIISTALVVYLFKNLSRSAFFDRIILTLKQEKTKGYKAPYQEFRDLIGKEGVTLTPLRPTGSAVIEEQRYDVISEGSFIDSETKIKVIRVEGSKIFVRSEYRNGGKE